MAKDEAAAPKPTAFIVEDDEATSHVLRFFLRREGFEVLHLADGREAEAHIAAAPPPSVAVLDMMLPYVDGLQLLRRIRGRLEWCAVPVIVLTAKSQEKDIVRALDAGATDYMVKPFRPEELLARIRRCLRSPA